MRMSVEKAIRVLQEHGIDNGDKFDQLLGKAPREPDYYLLHDQRR